MKYLNMLIIFLLFSTNLSLLNGQTTTGNKSQKFTLSGFISDEESNEFLIGATIYDATSGQGTTSNEYGFYSLSIPAGSCKIIYSYVGYSNIQKEIELTEDVSLSIYLSASHTLDEVVVSSEADADSRHTVTTMSVNKIDLDNMNKLPILLGEPDVFQLITLKPGVSSGNEGGGLNVRGGSADQNLILLDDVPVYNANHLFGFLSVFNGDAMKSAKIFKGGFPARYGGRLSSIIDVRMKEGNMKKLHGNINMGVLSWKFNLEGPVVKDKTSFMISARRTFIDLISTPILKSQYKKNESFNYWNYNFYDINAKINHKFSEKSRLYISSFYGNDNLANFSKFTPEKEIQEEDENKISFGNRIISGRWNYQLTPKLFSNTTLMYSKYRYQYTGVFDPNTKEIDPKNKITQSILSESNIEDLGAKLDFSFVPNSKNYIRFGANYINHTFTPTTNTQTFNNETTVSGNKDIGANEIAGYAEDEIKINNSIRINLGLHFSVFQVEQSNYNSLQPRFSASFNPVKDMSLKASYSRMTQYIHLLVSSGLGLPTDLWVPSTNKILPESSNQYALGMTKTIREGLELTIEGFYKQMENVVAYKSGQDIFASSDDWEKKVDQGDGTSYGVELLIEKNIGKTTGWLGYTFSKTQRVFKEINNGNSFPFKYDRTHDVNLVITHRLSKKMDLGLIWIYGTGNAYSFASTSYLDINGDKISSAERNNQRMAPYHRLDLSCNFHKDLRNGKRSWSYGLYNAYNRKNPFFISKRVSDFSGKTTLVQQSLLPIIPFVSYKRSF